MYVKNWACFDVATLTYAHNVYKCFHTMDHVNSIESKGEGCEAKVVKTPRMCKACYLCRMVIVLMTTIIVLIIN